LPTFVDVAARGGASFKHDASRTAQKYLIEAMGSGVAVFDGDGYLDVFFVNGAKLGDPMTLGFAAAAGKGLGVTICDFDRDGWPDLVVVNDTVAQQLFKNNRNGTFTEVGLALGLAYDDKGRAYAGMGVDCQDYDNDGWPDIFINALSNQTYALYHNNKGTFDDVTPPSGLAAITALYSGWGAKFVDYDNDGWKDLFVAQGHVLDQVQLEQPDVRYLEPMRNSRADSPTLQLVAVSLFCCHERAAARRWET
jgi:hypothetical protein